MPNETLYTLDGLSNLVANIGVAGKDKSAHSTFVDEVLTDVEIRALFGSTWLGRKIVSIPVGDVIRPWRMWQAETLSLIHI